MAERKPLFQTTEGFSEQMAASDSMQLGGLTMGGNIVMSNNKITGLGAPTADGDAATKSYVDTQVIQGGTVKEVIFEQNQLDNTDGINAAMVWFAENQPVAGDTVILTDGTNTRTYTFVANQGAESVETDVSIESSAVTAMERWVTRMLADSGNTWWDAVWRATEHPDIHTDGIVTVYEKASAAGASASRMYGTWATQADYQVIEYASGTTPDVDVDYSNETSATAATSDPGYGRFGLRRQVSALTAGEIHYVLTDDSTYSWDDDAQQWNVLSGSASIPDATSGSGGGIKGKVTFDSDKGLTVSAGVAEVDIDEVTLDFSSGTIQVTGVPSLFEVGGTAVGANVTAANLDTLTGGSGTTLHSHSHANATGQGEDDHHNRSHAITSSSDHTESGLTSGHCLQATGATTFAWQQVDHTDLASVGVNDHHNQQHVLDGGDHTVSGLTTGHLLTATSATTFAFQAPAAAEEAKKVENTLNTATDTTANGDPVYINGTDTLGKARADTDAKARVLGVVRSGAGAAPTAVEVVSHGEAAGVIAAATPNTPYYLAATGGLTTTVPSGGNRVIRMGIAISATDLWVDIVDYGKKAA